jgi:hypothetical protein
VAARQAQGTHASMAGGGQGGTQAEVPASSGGELDLASSTGRASLR